MVHLFTGMGLIEISSTKLLINFVLEILDTIFPFVAHVEKSQQKRGNH